jgi:hypothetical protein
VSNASRFQFSIRLMLVATAAVAAAFWVITSEPGWPSLMSLVFFAIAFATVSTIAAVCSGGRLRVFWVGASVMLIVGALIAVAGVMWLPFSVGRPSLESYEFTDRVLILSSFLRTSVAAFWLFAPFNGIICALVHWLFLRPTPQEVER